jgi:prevent-host-death family protein
VPGRIYDAITASTQVAEGLLAVYPMYTRSTMVRPVTTAEARRDWARVLRTARRGTPVVVTRHGQPIAAVVSIPQLRALERARSETLGEAIQRARSSLNVDDLAGPDPWPDPRGASVGRDIDVG